MKNLWMVSLLSVVLSVPLTWTPQFTDTFTGSLNDPLPTHDATWSDDDGAWQLGNSGQVGPNGATLENWSGNSTTLGSNQKCEVVFGVDSVASSGAGCAIHYTHTGSGTRDAYRTMSYVGTVYLVKDGGASGSVLDSASYTHVPGDTLSIENTGSAIEVFINGAQPSGGRVNATDSSFTGGGGAIYCYNFGKTCLSSYVGYDDSGGGSSFPAAIIPHAPIIGCCGEEPVKPPHWTRRF